ncbi:MAG: GDP-mannose 4,6-dehydratase, partial [Candidatus Helarchaeota archaeon]|nr:GDP-mannose 4,6-dehydratase [Candidatus Helarchaeota archaeon]
SKIKNPCILRISAPYGPGQRAKTVVRIFLENALRNQSLLFHGSGSRTQDFIYIDDVAAAFWAALRADANGIFNVACGEPISMKDLVVLIVSLIPGCASEIKPSGVEDPQENFRANYDISRAKEYLSWEPKVSLKEGIATYIKFLKKQL